MIDIENLTLKQIRDLSFLFGKETKNIYDEFIGKYVLVRTYSAGVHIGYLKNIKETEAILTSSRRIWKWEGAFTLSEISQDGIYKNSKLSKEIPIIFLTQAVEIIPCSDKAIKIFNSIEGYST